MIKYLWIVLLFSQTGWGNTITKKYKFKPFDNSSLPHLEIVQTNVNDQNNFAEKQKVFENDQVKNDKTALNEAKYTHFSSAKFRNYQIFEGRDIIISNEGKEHLRKWVQSYKSGNYKSVTINVHTDDVPPKLLKVRFATNLILSEARAKSIADYLIKQGIHSNQVNAKGLGDINPIAPNDSENGRSKNRRIEFTIKTTPLTY
ncbi:MAG: OmpA family protein [Sulfuricurvum sp.]|uniref:OmpA family protein n=1 Tax=Sulfuricurvum sp. TaxID=2025608 RepID=UPI0025F499AF|nr:OmpA family protein [Sulfuricurvum sp.]MBV5320765.1 OmpA family protein [Sulfuricurvum sp.]